MLWTFNALPCQNMTFNSISPLSPFLSLPLSYRTESVAEKMLTNWFTFLLYKFLKVSLSGTQARVSCSLGIKVKQTN